MVPLLFTLSCCCFSYSSYFFFLFLLLIFCCSCGSRSYDCDACIVMLLSLLLFLLFFFFFFVFLVRVVVLASLAAVLAVAAARNQSVLYFHTKLVEVLSVTLQVYKREARFHLCRLPVWVTESSEGKSTGKTHTHAHARPVRTQGQANRKSTMLMPGLCEHKAKQIESRRYAPLDVNHFLGRGARGKVLYHA